LTGDWTPHSMPALYH